MFETIFIVILSALVVLLTSLILLRRRRDRGSVLIREEAVNDLIASMAGNVADGKIQNIAGSVSNILGKHLDCDKIVFLKNFRSFLEMNFFSGIAGFNRNDFRFKLTPDKQKKLRHFQNVTGFQQLKLVFPKEYVEKLEALGLKYFFPVFLRDNLYGLYFIKTGLSPNDSSLNLLVTTLAFNLSAAYYISTQEQKIRKYESHIKSLKQNQAVDQAFSGKDVSKLLKVRNCQQLIPEMLKSLKKEGNFTRLGFYLKCDSTSSPFMSVSWNMGNKADKMFEDNYEQIVKNLESGKTLNLDNAFELGDTLKNNLKDIQGSSNSQIISLDWADQKKAVIVFGGKKLAKDALELVKRFHREAVPFMENITRFEKAEELSYTDGLTGMRNFRYFKKRIDEEFQRAKRYNRNLALLIIDLDDLKVVNDKHGHLAGDSLIKSFGNVLSGSVRSNDVVTRYGGDEFCILMPETSREEARVFMTRIRSKADNEEFSINWTHKKLTYTVSIGGAVFPNDANTAEELIHAADMALLEAKSSGRNCARIYQPEYNRKD